MTIPESVISGTEERFAARQGPRASTEEKIAEAHSPQGSILDVDAPKRVSLRAVRIAQQPLVQDVLRAAAPISPVPSGAVIEEGHLLERIIDGNNLLGIAFLELGTEVSRSVSRIAIGNGFQTRGFGTGFMVSPRLLLTNNHVLATVQSARYSHAEFNFQTAVDGLALPPSRFRLEPDALFLTDVALDFTLVAVASDSLPDENGKRVPLSTFGFRSPSPEQGKILLGESINIIQHPEGQLKQISLQQNELVDRLEFFLHYRTDTSPGSSGSPLYNNQWEILGIHHSGVPARNEAGKILSVDGTVWTAAQGESRIKWVANEGVRVSSILQWLGNHADDVAPDSRALLNELLVPVPTAAPAHIRTSAVETGSAPSAPADEPMEARESVSVTIPLQITVRLGDAQTLQRAHDSDAGQLAEEAISIDPNYAGRKGYDPQFLGVPVTLPVLSDQQKAEAAVNRWAPPGEDPTVLNYHHFSLVMHRLRRLPFYTAVNVDGGLIQSPKRDKDKWFFDPRLVRQEQIGEDLYTSNDFDRGHLVRRLDPAWGSETDAKNANDDTFHFTNCSPQHKNFNQGDSLWAGLEDFLLGTAKVEKRRLTVFTGPVFSAEDPVYRGHRIPLAFWKIAVFQHENGGPSATAYLISQRDQVEDILREAFIPATFQVPVRTVSALTELNFDHLFGWDPLDSSFIGEIEAEEALAAGAAGPGRELHSFSDLTLS